MDKILSMYVISNTLYRAIIYANKMRIGSPQLETGLDDNLRLALQNAVNEKQTDLLLEEQRTIIDDLERRLLTHRRNIAAIQSRRNTFAPRINLALPPEVLGEIFLQLTLLYRVGRSKADLREYAWFKTAHVCRYWRDVILNNPVLFSYVRVPTCDPDLYDNFVRYAGSAQLTIRLDNQHVPSENWDAFWDNVASYLPRARHIRFDINPGRNRAWPQCPQTTTLAWYAIDGVADKTLHDALGSLPNLRILESNTSTLGKAWFKLPMPSTLTTIRLLHYYKKHAGPTFLKDLGAMLATLKSLTILDLQLLSNEYRDTDYIVGPPLPRLQLLKLTGAPHAISRLMKLPLHAIRVDIELINNHAPAGRIDAGTRMLSLRLPRAMFKVLSDGTHSPQIPVFSFDLSNGFNSHKGWKFEIQGQKLIERIREDSTIFRFAFNWPHGQISTRFFETGQAIVEDFRPLMSGTSTLILKDSIHRRVDAGTPYWISILSYFPEVRVVYLILKKIQGSWAAESTNTQSTQIETLQSSDENPVPQLPRLERLVVYQEESSARQSLSLFQKVLEDSSRIRQQGGLKGPVMDYRFKACESRDGAFDQELSAIMGESIIVTYVQVPQVVEF